MKKIFLFVITLFGIFMLSACSQNIDDGKLDEFATCIKDAGINVYVMDGCGHCINQKKLFGSSFDKLNIINCTSEREKCGAIEWTPTWVLPNAEQYAGVQSLEELAELSNCELPAEDL